MGCELSPISSLEIISKRLPLIFPEGTEHRNFVIRDTAVRSVFVMLYAGAIEGTDRWIRPNQIIIMTDMQASKTSNDERFQWAVDSLKNRRSMAELSDKSWYATDTRESIRDETIRKGFMHFGCVIERAGLSTTSQLPRYALQADFAKLFNENLTEEEAEIIISSWRETYMTPEKLARIRVMQRSLSALKDGDNILVTFPNGESRQMAPGPSSLLSKAVIEQFAKRFLKNPAVIHLSESRKKIISPDDDLAKRIGINILTDKVLPDIILIDLGTEIPLLIFVEIVNSDGQISEHRKQELLAITNKGNYKEEHVLFLSAFNDRGADAYKKLCSDLAWGSLVWFASEPECILVFNGREETKNKSIIDIVN